MNPEQPPQATDDTHHLKVDETALVEMLNRRIEESQSYWNDKKYKLDRAVKVNEDLYFGPDATDEDETEGASDNRIFSSVRTIVPYVTSRITEPEVCPSSNQEAAQKFAEDFEQALYIKAKEEKVREKTKFALEDAILRRRGYLKPRYDAVMGNFCAVEYVPAESIIIDHKARTYEEPRYFRHLLEKSVEDLLTMFPEQEAKIKEAFGIDEHSTKQQLEAVHTVNEDWVFVPDETEGLDLIVCWHYNAQYLGGMRDPNWLYDGQNFLPHHMMPLVFINVLNDGRGYIDRTSFPEQARFLQENVDERTRQISKNAGLGSVGMPVVDSAALADDQAEYLTFDSDQALILDVRNSGKNSVRDVFDLWKSGPLPSFVYEDKLDARNSIDNTFGTPNVFRGEQSDNNTLGQDVLVRDQAFGRQQEIVDSIDAAMSRLYMLIAQFMLVYGDEEVLFNYVGEDSEFDYVLLNTEELDTNVKIRVKSGTSMPIDRAQRRATADKAAGIKMIDPLTYWEIMDEGNAEKYAKRLVEFMADPPAFLKETEEKVFNRDAYVDIQLVLRGQEPPYRDDLPKEYFDHLNQYVLSGNLDNPGVPEENRQAVTAFIDAQLARGQKMLGMLETQLPTPDEVTSHNEQVDQANQADAAAMKAAGPQPEAPTPPPPAVQNKLKA